MSSLSVLLTLSGLLGITSFGVGILPLSLTFSGGHMSRLSSLGTGLLLGAALGVIIPEGIETLAHSRLSSPLTGASIALPLLSGFTLMLVLEQLSSSYAHPHHRTHSLGHHAGVALRDFVFDVELADDPGHLHASTTRASIESDVPPPAYPMTIGLVVHGLADGLALGMSVLSSTESSPSYGLSLVVFLALAIHKAPTALAYTISLMSTSLSRADCRKHLLLFSASTPVGAITSYASFSFFGSQQVDRVGTALLISGGSFLYVATVLQPISHHRPSSEAVGTKMRIFLLLLGIFTPFALGSLLDHGHSHSADAALL
ncbi:Zinc/iron permease [Multifurca ochricompacta]|uniref:Zinc/iron permease n=1 Tax=Multifurca ochricompacta TaxID=376703 RepID=A0AAD4M7Q6_9AGAM|nr:Zinc/iron permease [Multifurca ochricompacta]